MPFLTAADLGSLTVDEMIFHAVGPAEHALVLVDEPVPAEHADFFLERVKGCANGVAFQFLTGSSVQHALRTINDDRGAFVEQSKVLARLFHEQHTGNTTSGAFMIMSLTCEGGKLYALLKFENETVIAYTTRTRNGKTTLDLQRLKETIVQAKERLHKSALIRLSPHEGGELTVIDRVNRKEVTNYFRAFLQVEREHDPSELTKIVFDSAKTAALANKDTIAPEVFRDVTRRLFDAVETFEGYDPETLEFENAVFGAVTAQSPVVQAFHQRLRSRHVEHETFVFDKEAIERPQSRQIITAEGVRVIYSNANSELVTRADAPGGGKLITIRTRDITSDDYYSDARTNRP